MIRVNRIFSIALAAAIAAFNVACSEPDPWGNNFDDDEWEFSAEVETKSAESRGIGDPDRPLCRPVTTATRAIDVEAIFTPDPGPSRSFSGDATVRFFVFEYQPFLADAGADCVGGGILPLDGTPVRARFELPRDREDLAYYVTASADLDGNEEYLDDCIDYFTGGGLGNVEPDVDAISLSLLVRPCP